MHDYLLRHPVSYIVFTAPLFKKNLIWHYKLEKFAMKSENYVNLKINQSLIYLIFK